MANPIKIMLAADHCDCPEAPALLTISGLIFISNVCEPVLEYILYLNFSPNPAHADRSGTHAYTHTHNTYSRITLLLKACVLIKFDWASGRTISAATQHTAHTTHTHKFLFPALRRWAANTQCASELSILHSIHEKCVLH